MDAGDVADRERFDLSLEHDPIAVAACERHPWPPAGFVHRGGDERRREVGAGVVLADEDRIARPGDPYA